MGPETACETSEVAQGPGTGMDLYCGLKSRVEPKRVYPATVDELRARRSQLRETQRRVSQKLEVLNSLIALWED